MVHLGWRLASVCGLSGSGDYNKKGPAVMLVRFSFRLSRVSAQHAHAEPLQHRHQPHQRQPFNRTRILTDHALQEGHAE